MWSVKFIVARKLNFQIRFLCENEMSLQNRWLVDTKCCLVLFFRSAGKVQLRLLDFFEYQYLWSRNISVVLIIEIYKFIPLYWIKYDQPLLRKREKREKILQCKVPKNCIEFVYYSSE